MQINAAIRGKLEVFTPKIDALNRNRPLQMKSGVTHRNIGASYSYPPSCADLFVVGNYETGNKEKGGKILYLIAMHILHIVLYICARKTS